MELVLITAQSRPIFTNIDLNMMIHNNPVFYLALAEQNTVRNTNANEQYKK